MVTTEETTIIDLAEDFVPIKGKWRFTPDAAFYDGPDNGPNGATFPEVGICLHPSRFRSGTLSFRAKIDDFGKGSCARAVLGYNAETENYFSVGIGGYGYAYVSDVCFANRSWRPHKVQGSTSNLTKGKFYDIEIKVEGQQMTLSVDGVQVLADVFPSPLQGDQAGLFAWGTGLIEFQDYKASGDDSRLFVVMQYGEPYDGIYKHVIKQVCKKSGFEAFRADDIFRPGVVLQDIIRGIIESDIVLAEITPANPNVFYELGYAHALGKPTVLLADRQIKLPFDVSGYRVIFYDNTIAGKKEIEVTLTKHLENIKAGRK